MSDAPIEFIMAAFDDEEAADQALQELQQAKKEKLVGIRAAAVVRRDMENKLHIHERGELTPGKGAAGGAALGVVLGVLTGGAGLVLGAVGAAVGAVIGKVRDTGFANERLAAIGQALKPGTSAIIAVIEHKWVRDLERELEQLGADVVTAAIAADIADELAAGRDVSYSAVVDAEGLTTSRVAVGADQVASSSTRVTAEGTVSETSVSTEEATIVQRTVTTGDTSVVETMTVTGDAADYEALVVDSATGEVLGSVTGSEETGSPEIPADPPDAAQEA